MPRRRDAEIARLTLLPGFSTRDAVTEISGRGVGLDVVATRLRALSGSIDIRSEAGRGLTIELRFQASLVATHALFVRDGGQVFGLASHAVRRAVPAVAVRAHARERRVVRAGRRRQISRARTRHAHRPRARLQRPSAATWCWSTANAGPMGVLVDAVLDASELVTRPAGRYLKRIPGVAGIGLLGNGSVIPLLDVAELARSPREISHARRRRGALARRTCAARACSWSTTRCRCAARSRRCSKTRATTSRMARDGLEAVKPMEVARPDVLLTDLEMPNMNGLELSAARALRAPSSPASPSS